MVKVDADIPQEIQCTRCTGVLSGFSQSTVWSLEDGLYSCAMPAIHKLGHFTIESPLPTKKYFLYLHISGSLVLPFREPYIPFDHTLPAMGTFPSPQLLTWHFFQALN